MVLLQKAGVVHSHRITRVTAVRARALADERPEFVLLALFLSVFCQSAACMCECVSVCRFVACKG